MKMKRLTFLILAVSAIFVSNISLGQSDDRALVSIAGEDVTVDEFMYVYKKNNQQTEETIDKKSVKEYLDLYINFKLKVKEAEALGYDTVSAFKEELAGYRKQLAEPYFVDEEVIEGMLSEAYARKKHDIRASHILVMIGPNAMPEDTLAAYNKIMDARKRVLNGEDFATVAQDVSEDPSARDRQSPRNNQTIPGNGGDLGYFSVFDMVYPFETGAYNTKVGEVSEPVRTDFGYHVIKVTDRIPAQGNIEVAHIYLQMKPDATAADSAELKQKAEDLYKRIQNGENYEDLCKEFSDDKSNARSGGRLPKFKVNRMVPEFIEAISMMNDSGMVSKPVQTSYGYHLIKLYGKTGLEPFDEVKDEMRKRIEKDKRAQKGKDVIIREIKEEYGFKIYHEGLAGVYDVVDSSVFKGKFVVPATDEMTKPVFTIGETTYVQNQFLKYVEDNQNISSKETLKEFVNRKFHEFTDEECRKYEDSRLEEKYPEFRAIVKEYRDGILLFELTNEKIWSYASQDTSGLHKYYEEHSNDFMWDRRLDASIYTVKDTAYVKQIREMITLGTSDDEVVKLINRDSLDIVSFQRKKFLKEENRTIDKIKWKKGLSENLPDGSRTVFVNVHAKVPSEPKSFDEARGLITAGYQEQLEKEWITELKGKYPVIINEEVLNSLTK
jgi:peptidyl-prolyl cis-trans isomerase SurA